jgi:hypothetical protein
LRRPCPTHGPALVDRKPILARTLSRVGDLSGHGGVCSSLAIGTVERVRSAVEPRPKREAAARFPGPDLACAPHRRLRELRRAGLRPDEEPRTRGARRDPWSDDRDGAARGGPAIYEPLQQRDRRVRAGAGRGHDAVPRGPPRFACRSVSPLR